MSVLFILTGDVQIGKTRWLVDTVDRLSREGVFVGGVLAPGVWRERESGEPEGVYGMSGLGRFEKLGIDNVLLPEGTRIRFAERSDLCASVADRSQSTNAQLAWSIDDAAIACVNEHFCGLVDGDGADCSTQGGLLVVDELGRLELMHGCGLDQAVRILDDGPSKRFPNALVVVREQLLDLAQERFAGVWPEVMVIGPDGESEQKLRDVCLVR